MSQEKISCLIFLAPLPNKKISCLLSQKKISCLMRNSHVWCFLHKSHKKISWDMRFSHETWDRRFSHGGAVQIDVLSHEKISCLKRKSHVSREYLISYHFWPPQLRKSRVSCLMRKSHISWDFLLGFKEKAWDMRISHETGDFLLDRRQEIFLLGIGAKKIRHEIFS